ncbi:MAG: c-type cytochrome [Thermodesulfobacteriota bacterium]
MHLKFIHSSRFKMLLTAFLYVFNFHTFVSVSNAESGNEVVVKGEKVFKDKGCVACHSIGKGKIVGPDLSGVTKRREAEWIKKWIMSPDTMIYTDPIAKELLKVYLVPMPNQGLTGEEAVILIEYFKYEDAHNAK